MLCLFLLSNNVDLKNYTRNYRKPLWILWVRKQMQKNLFQVDLDKPWNYLWHFYKKAPPPPLPPLRKVKGQCPRYSPALRMHWGTTTQDTRKVTVRHSKLVAEHPSDSQIYSRTINTLTAKVVCLRSTGGTATFRSFRSKELCRM